MALDHGPQNEIRDQDVTLQEDLIGHDAEDLAFLQTRPGDVVLNTPKPAQRLEQFSVICIICNRMIGTGIFQTPSTVIKYTHSVGITMLFWVAGAVAAMAGILVYIEFGLTTPRYQFGRRKISVPRNGGELHYLKDIFKRPAFLSTCVFGVIFLLLGTSAMNAMSFGIRVLEAADRPVDNFTSRGIAIAVITFAVILHGTWRQAGIWVNNAFAVVKILILLLIILTGLISWGGVFNPSKDKANYLGVPTSNPGVAASNFSVHNAFRNPSHNSYGFAESFLSVIFAYGGFNQANYVLSEIDNPRKKYKWPAFFAVAGVCTLYILVNVAYFLVVPAEVQIQNVNKNIDVATTFFALTFGTLSNNSNNIAPRVFAAFMAVSSLGNIIVMTYTAARVKQEIAKEGILPFGKFIARSIRIPSVPVGRLFGRSSKPTLEETPLGGLTLHWIISIILILATAAQHNAQSSYEILVSLYSFTIDATFASLLGFGLLFLRFSSARKWALKSKANSVVSIIAATIFTIANVFPLIAAWVPPTKNFEAVTGKNIPWFTTPVVGWSLIVLGVVYWIGFYYVIPHIGNHRGKELKVHRKLFFQEEHGYPVQWHEQLSFRWVVVRNRADSFGYADEEIEIRLRGEEPI